MYECIVSRSRKLCLHGMAGKHFVFTSFHRERIIRIIIADLLQKLRDVNIFC